MWAKVNTEKSSGDRSEVNRMTTEQAIELLMSVKWNANIDEQEDMALSMAIEALSKTKRDLSEYDLISRRDAISGKMVTVISDQTIEVIPVSHIQGLPSVQLDKAYELGWKAGRESFREDAIDAVNKRIQFLKGDPVFMRKHGDIDLYGIKPIIRSLPPAQPEDVIHITGRRKFVSEFDFDEDELERGTGEWIDEGDPLTLRCSKCGYQVARYNNTNFCPNCGNYKRDEEE